MSDTKYKITIREVYPDPSTQYPDRESTREIYEQVITDLDVKAVIAVANKLYIPKRAVDNEETLK